jgi:hypothetical protein
MYEDAESELKRILELVDLCPEPLRPKAFEILLQGYVSKLSAPSQLIPGRTPGLEKGKPINPIDLSRSVPSEILSRLTSMAKRRGITPEQLAALFDFTSEPLAYVPINVQGESMKDRTRKVTLLVAARSFLGTGRWLADWSEIKAMSIHQNCYDVKNFATAIKEGKGGVFKSVDGGISVELSASGTEAAEKLLAELAQPDASE